MFNKLNTAFTSDKQTLPANEYVENSDFFVVLYLPGFGAAALGYNVWLAIYVKAVCKGTSEWKPIAYLTVDRFLHPIHIHDT